jgi:Mn2+/Fe2+ NRAMP family transporter
VQSTRAGAGWGFALTWAIFFALLFKYPFFEFGSRYVAGTGASLIEGYRRQGRWVLWLYILITISTMFVVEGAVTLVTSALFAHVFDIGLGAAGWAAIIFTVCTVVLILGRFSLLDRIVRVVIFILFLSTIAALALASGRADFSLFSFSQQVNILRPELLGFSIALMGWMPTSLDIPVWQTIWVLEERKHKLMRDPAGVLQDFNVGYAGTGILAFMFMLLGAFVMYGSGEQLSTSGVQFAGQFIRLYVGTLGEWSFWIIAAAALTTMASTTLTVLDAFPRVLGIALESALNLPENETRSRSLRIVLMILLAIGSYLIIAYMTGNLKGMVDFATTLSFVVAPVLAIFNYRAVTGKDMPTAMKPRLWLKLLAVIGWLYLSAFTLFFLWTKFI